MRKRQRINSDEEAGFILSEREARGIKEALQASPVFGPDMKRRVKNSLQETLADIHNEYPELDNQDFVGARTRAASELSEMAERLSTPGSMKPSRASDEALWPPPLQLPPAQEVVPLDTDQLLAYEGLVDHEQLMQAIYASQGLDYAAVQGQAHRFLSDLGLRPHDLGVKNTDEVGKVLVNQCFYLSIAHSYLGNDVEEHEVPALALRLKRAIETSVLASRLGWAGSRSGNSDDSVSGDEGSAEIEAMAFADFLPLAMHAKDEADGGGGRNLTAELAICVLDSVQGHVEVFLGPDYESLDKETKERHLILLWYTPGHYQCLVCDDAVGSKVVMAYDEFKDLLTKHGVVYIETTE